jgi:hypothetical protein
MTTAALLVGASHQFFRIAASSGAVFSTAVVATFSDRRARLRLDEALSILSASRDDAAQSSKAAYSVRLSPAVIAVLGFASISAAFGLAFPTAFDPALSAAFAVSALVAACPGSRRKHFAWMVFYALASMASFAAASFGLRVGWDSSILGYRVSGDGMAFLAAAAVFANPRKGDCPGPAYCSVRHDASRVALASAVIAFSILEALCPQSAAVASSLAAFACRAGFAWYEVLGPRSLLRNGMSGRLRG